jgi:2,3,4,5-tetrahydropyridine-2-carboxylate N-succinyltransferase
MFPEECTKNIQPLSQYIDSVWQVLSDLSPSEKSQKISEIRQDLALQLDHIRHLLTEGDIQVVEPPVWQPKEWIKKAILLMFQVYESRGMGHSGQEYPWRDKMPMQFILENDPKNRRLVPGAWVRSGACLGHSVIAMPCFINIGAFVGNGSMIDSGTSVGSCAYIGQRCHISSTVTIGGVLEPLQAKPVIIEDDCFIGAGCHVLEGIHIGSGSVLGAGVVLTASTKIMDRASGHIIHGHVPSGSVVVPGTYQINDNMSLQCAVIIKTVDLRTRQKTGLTDLLRC